MASDKSAESDPVSKAQKSFIIMASSTRQDSNAQTQYSPSQQYSGGGGGCPVISNQPSPQQQTGGGCPVVGINPSNNMPSSPNAPLPGQSKPLSTWRQHSSIPTGTTTETSTANNTSNTKDTNTTWVYPSEQMFYNAMKRKGWSPDEDDMTAVVAIHNAVNERAWKEILHWEKVNGTAEQCGGPRLVKFQGRPQDYSPKARLLNFLGYKLPFDRHDWVVDRCGKQVRYVIDFYNAAPQPHMPAALHLDVRPALDSPLALYERLRMQWRWVASGRWRRE